MCAGMAHAVREHSKTGQELKWHKWGPLLQTSPKQGGRGLGPKVGARYFKVMNNDVLVYSPVRLTRINRYFQIDPLATSNRQALGHGSLPASVLGDVAGPLALATFQEPHTAVLVKPNKMELSSLLLDNGVW